MVLGSPTDRPLIHIEFIKNPFQKRSRQESENAYEFYAIALFGAFLLSIAFLSNAATANAFWPFAAANAAGTATPMVHDPSISLLQAANNTDPNPTKSSGPLATSEGVALLSYQGPDGVPSGDSIVVPASSQISSYIVRSGDTLSEIAEMFNVSVNTIVWANNLGSTKAIHPGQTLAILPVSGIEHTVVKGETLSSLAKKYGGNANDIASYNGLDDGAALVAGSLIIIPGGELSTPAAAPVKGSTSHPATSISSEPYLGGSGPEIDDYFINPVPGAVLTQSIHGWNAVDLGISKGTPIHAAAAGHVVVAMDNGGWNGGYGNYVVISHPNGTQTLYAHMVTGSVSVHVGDDVDQNDIIGKVGMTGLATGPHLHFEVRGAKNPFYSCPTGAVCQPK